MFSFAQEKLYVVQLVVRRGEEIHFSGQLNAKVYFARNRFNHSFAKVPKILRFILLAKLSPRKVIHSRYREIKFPDKRLLVYLVISL